MSALQVTWIFISSVLVGAVISLKMPSNMLAAAILSPFQAPRWWVKKCGVDVENITRELGSKWGAQSLCYFPVRTIREPGTGYSILRQHCPPHTIFTWPVCITNYISKVVISLECQQVLVLINMRVQVAFWVIWHVVVHCYINAQRDIPLYKLYRNVLPQKVFGHLAFVILLPPLPQEENFKCQVWNWEGNLAYLGAKLATV